MCMNPTVFFMIIFVVDDSYLCTRYDLGQLIICFCLELFRDNAFIGRTHKEILTECQLGLIKNIREERNARWCKKKFRYY